jgi:hypothetical protein
MSKDPRKVEDIQKLAKQQISDEFEDGDVGDKSEVISSKKIVYIEIDDEVTAVYDKIKNLKIPHIYIVAPQRAVIFQSIVNLKILKRKTEESGKSIYLITNDKNGVYLAGQVGIPVYDRLSTSGRPVLFTSEEEDEKIRITPIKAAVNAVIDDTPTRLAEKKVSISEILKSKREKKGFPIMKKFSEKKPAQDLVRPKEEKAPKHKLTFVAPNKQALVGLAAISLFILLVIFYIALPGVTVYLTPAASVLEKSANIVLADYEKNRAEIETSAPHTVASHRLSAKIEKTIIYFSTGKKLSQNAANASGKLTIFNNANYSWPLVEKTRFQTNEGLVFRITSPVEVPAATSTGPGKVEVYVTADPLDAYGQIAGQKANIGPTKFFLPALREDSRSVLYAESFGNMTGGITDYVNYVSADDIKAAESKLKETLLKAVQDELKKQISLKNDSEGTDYVLLTGEEAIETSDVQINPVSSLQDQELAQFDISGNLTAYGYYYSKNEMLNLLTQELMLKKSPQKKLVKINEDTVTYRIFEKDSVHGKIKVTANIKGIEEFEIDPEKENGARLIEKIKEHIAGKNIEEAKSYIQNLPEINKVEIESWPAWSPTVPSVADNIKIEIRDAVMVE